MTLGGHGTTFGGNPLAMSVANAVLDILLKEGFLKNVEKNAKYFNTCIESGMKSSLESADNTLIAFKKWNGFNNLKNITKKAVNNDYNSTLNVALRDINKLTILQKDKVQFEKNPFSIADRINTLIYECKTYGTLPFSIIARHGFIAENLLRSAISNNAITSDRVKEFKRSFNTVAGDMSDDFQKVLKKKLYLI